MGSFQDTFIVTEIMIKGALINVSNELRKLKSTKELANTSDIELLEKLAKVYEDLITVIKKESRLIHDSPELRRIEIFRPLMKLIAVSSVNCEWEKTYRFVDALVFLSWYCLNSRQLYDSLVNVFASNGNLSHEYCQVLLLFCEKPQLATLYYSYWHSRELFEFDSIELKKLSQHLCFGYLTLIVDRVKVFHQRIQILIKMQQKETFTEQENHQLVQVLNELRESSGKTNERELLALMTHSLGLMDMLQHVTAKNVSNSTIESIEKYREGIQATLDWNEINFLKEEVQQYLLPRVSISYSNFRDHRNLLLFLLEVLDHGTTIDYREATRPLCYITLSLRSIGKVLHFDAQLLYTKFNRLYSRVSLSTLFVNLTYILVSSLSRGQDTFSLPTKVTDFFQRNRMAPLPKSEVFFQDSLGKDNFGNKLTLPNCDDSTQKIEHCIALSLNCLRVMLQDEFQSLAKMTTKISVQQKCLQRKLDFVFASICSSLIYLHSLESKDTSDRLLMKDESFKILESLILSEYDFIENSLMWVSLINFCSDICYQNISCFPIFGGLLEYLIEKSNKSLCRLPLVNKSLNFFFATFDNVIKKSSHSENVNNLHETSSERNSEEVTIQWGQYSFLYQHRNTTLERNKKNYWGSGVLSDTASTSSFGKNTNSSLLLNTQYKNSTTATPHLVQHKDPKPNYVTNSARQQSVHVDDFGR